VSWDARLFLKVKARILSLFIVCAYLVVIVAGYVRNQANQESLNEYLWKFFAFAVWILLALACIWFGDEMGSSLGSYRVLDWISKSTIPTVVFLGWVLLLLPLVVFAVSAILKKSPI